MCRLWCVYVALVASVSALTRPRVHTAVGEIVGVQDEFVQFLGVPYASVDEDDAFGPADPNVRLDSPYYATKAADVCPQIVKGIAQGTLHCLTLNIYKPINVSKILPVMVFIHGGAFQQGDGNPETYSPKYLVEHGVIVVAVNYRLGPYGFICPEEEKYQNQGYKDQELAFKWVKNNIKDFGGDANNMLLFGHSSGSLSVDYHISSNKEKYFNKFILQSGVQVSPIVTKEIKGQDYLADVATKLRIYTKDLNTIDILNELSKMHTFLVITVTENDIFRPCIRDFTINAPSESYLKDTKIIIGNTNKEPFLFYKHVKNYTDKIKTEMKENFDNIPDEEIAKVEKLYFKGDNKSDAEDFATDLYFVYPMERSIRHYLRNGATVYRYVFSYDGNRNMIKIRDNIVGKGAAHGDDLGYLFDSDLFNKTVDARDREVIDVLTSHWTNFAKYGDPTYDPDRPWPEYTEDIRTYLSIGSSSSVLHDYHKDQKEFWDSFYKKYGGLHQGFHYGDEIAFRNGVGRMDLAFIFVVTILLVRYLV